MHIDSVICVCFRCLSLALHAHRLRHSPVFDTSRPRLRPYGNLYEYNSLNISDTTLLIYI
ncbi:hypothetical protein Hanom_Chr05g00467921 [Helianthus anomalus]